MRFNERQLEGFAKIVDNLATASVVAAIVGGIVDHKIDVSEVAVLNMFAVVLAALGAYFRKGERDD
jgi:MFS-type transporter involved in bile tolerance (Atg22 family)